MGKRTATSTAGTFETYDVRADRIGQELRDIRRAGGQVTRSAPVAGGYALTVFWRD